MKSYNFADNLEKLAAFLRSKPEFETGTEKVYAFFSYYDKEQFLSAVKATGTGKKEFTDSQIYFYPAINGAAIHVRIEAPRNTVCRLVQEAVYDCEPFLAEKDEKELGAE